MESGREAEKLRQMRLERQRQPAVIFLRFGFCAAGFGNQRLMTQMHAVEIAHGFSTAACGARWFSS